MRYAVVLLLAGCVTTSEVHLADGSVGHNISCPGAARNFSDCLAKAGEICGASGYVVVNREGDAVPASVAVASFNANRQSASGTYAASGGSVATRNLFVKCHARAP